MSNTSLATPENANLGTDQVSYRNTTSGRTFSEALIKFARKLWANHVAAELAIRTGMSVRTAERWLAGDRSMSGDAVIALLQSDRGVAFLEALIADMPRRSQKQWRKAFDDAARRVDLLRRQALLDAEMEALDD